MKKAIINGGIGSKVICAVTDDVTLEAAPIKGTDNGDGTASLLVASSMAVLPDTTSGDLASIAANLATIQADLATVKADIILIKTDVAKLPQKDQLHANIVFSSASDQPIIAAPGVGKRIRLTRLSLSSGGDPQVNVEVALKTGSTTIETVKGAAMVFDYPEHRNLGTNEAFVVQCTTADRVIGGVDYYIEAV